MESKINLFHFFNCGGKSEFDKAIKMMQIVTLSVIITMSIVLQIISNL